VRVQELHPSWKQQGVAVREVMMLIMWDRDGVVVEDETSEFGPRHTTRYLWRSML